MDLTQIIPQALAALSAVAGAIAAYFKYRSIQREKQAREIEKTARPPPVPKAPPKPVIDDEAVSELLAQMKYGKKKGDKIHVRLGKENVDLDEF